MKFSDHFFEYNNMKYFRDNAHSVRLGTYGEKKDELGPSAYIATVGHIKPAHLDGAIKNPPTMIDLDLRNTSRTDIGGDGSFKVFGADTNVAVRTTFETATRETFKLVYFAIDQNPLERILNKDAGVARNYLAEEGNDARIVSGIWIVMDYQLAKTFASSTTLSASLTSDGQGLNLSAANGKTSIETITIGDSTFAYMLHKVKKWDKGKSRIEELEDDTKGMG